MSVAEATISDQLAERAHDLLEQGRVCLVSGWEGRASVVCGMTAWYCCRAYDDHVTCDCLAGSSGALCSHAIASMILWKEAMDDPFLPL